MLGLPAWASKGGILNVVAHHIRYLEQVNPATTALSVLAVIFLMNAKRLKKALKSLKRPLRLLGGEAIEVHWTIQRVGSSSAGFFDRMASRSFWLPRPSFATSTILLREVEELWKLSLPGGG